MARILFLYMYVGFFCRKYNLQIHLTHTKHTVLTEVCISLAIVNAIPITNKNTYHSCSVIEFCFMVFYR